MDLIERAAEHLEKAKGEAPDPGVLEVLSREAADGPAQTDDAPPQARRERPVEALPRQVEARESKAEAGSDGAVQRPPEPQGAGGSSSGPGSSSKYVELDFSRFKKNGLILPFGKSNRLTEEFRHIKRDVLTLKNLENVPNSNMIMVTSAAPGEGKTHTALNLALSIASERDLTALIIDADFSRPRVLDRLGVKSAERGLIDLLDDPTLDVSDVLVRTNIETFSMIPAGPKHQRSTELLSSRRMQQVAREIAERYSDRIIIFDTAPLLATSEPAVLVKLVGQILVVVEAEKTTKGAISSAVEMIKGHQGVGFILNKVRPQFGGAILGGYYDHYTYGYKYKK